MSTRRTFLKIISFFAAMIIPWTILPQKWRQSLSYLVGRPSVKLDIAEAGEADSYSIPVKVLSRRGYEDIQALCETGMQGRRAGTPGETRTLVYLEDQLQALSLQPFGNEKYFQAFSIPAMEERVINGRALFRPKGAGQPPVISTNLLAGIKGKNQRESIIISAHYDHLGMYMGELYRGANDNASGVGCVLEVMRRLTGENLKGIVPEINVVAAFWGAEEMGVLGSKHFVKNPTIPLSEIKAIINFDTVAAGSKEEFILWSERDNSLIQIIQKTGLRNGARIERTGGAGHLSDDSPFQDTGVAAVTVLSRDWLVKNHTKEDDLTTINQEKLDLACNILYHAVKELAY